MLYPTLNPKPELMLHPLEEGLSVQQQQQELRERLVCTRAA